MRRLFMTLAAYAASLIPLAAAESDEITGRHFPDRMHSFIWRNWECVSLDKIAEVLEADTAEVEKIGLSMGLPPHVEPTPEYRTRGYITIIRRNWHLVSRRQLLILLGWSEERLENTLRNDDAIGYKLGRRRGGAVKYIKPTPESRKRCAEIKTVVEKYFRTGLSQPGESRFGFVEAMSCADPEKKKFNNSDSQLRFIYSYMSLFGDSLSDSELNPLPDGLLQKYAEEGINGVWFHVTLWDLAPSDIFPGAGKGWETRLANLAAMAERAGRFGIKIYLYIREPRTSPDATGNPLEIKRPRCTSDPNIRKWIKDSLIHVFRKVPQLGGVFTITASESPTNCWCYGAWGNVPDCPDCRSRGAVEVLSELNRTIAEAVWAENPTAKVIVWDWGWADSWTEEIIARLPPETYFMSVSEWGIPVKRGAVTAKIGEYSISAVGPGQRAKDRWAAAGKASLKTAAKVQLNCTWEISNVPYVPAMELVARHCRNLGAEKIDGLMLSWSLGGCPSPNLRLASLFRENPGLSEEDALERLARERYGNGYTEALTAWKKFSAGYEEFPYGLGLYFAPTQLGPSNLLYPVATGQGATTVCFCFDDIGMWLGQYTAEGLAEQFDTVTEKWGAGIPYLEKAMDKTSDPQHRKNIMEDLVIAKAVYVHFKSVSNQIKFTDSRNQLAVASADKRQNHMATAMATAVDEIVQAKLLYDMVKLDSRIGYEASNHYAYLPLDLVEKVINCDYIINNPGLMLRSE